MKKTTLCYIERNNCYLMMLRNKKENDANQGKYVGVGGKFEMDETPDECLLREVAEETGLLLTSYRQRGVISFISDTFENEEMYLYTADAFTYLDKSPVTEDFPKIECNEGTLEWIDISDVESIPTWEGDKYFLRELAAGNSNIQMTLEYKGDTLVRAQLGQAKEGTIYEA